MDLGFRVQELARYDACAAAAGREGEDEKEPGERTREEEREKGGAREEVRDRTRGSAREREWGSSGFWRV